MAARACTCAGVRRVEWAADVLPTGAAVGAGAAGAQAAGVVLAGLAGTAATGAEKGGPAAPAEAAGAGAWVGVMGVAPRLSVGVGAGVTVAAPEGVVGVDGVAAGVGAPPSTRGRFGAAGDEVSGEAPWAGRGESVGVCVASGSDSGSEAGAAATLDGPAPGMEVDGVLSSGGAACGPASATGAALVKISGAHPVSTNWPSPPAVAAAAAAAAAVENPPLW